MDINSEIILLKDYPQEGIYAGEHGLLLYIIEGFLGKDSCIAEFTREDGSVINVSLEPEDFEYPDFTLADKEWIDAIKADQLTIDDLKNGEPSKKLGFDDWD